MHIALAQISSTLGDFAGNTRRIISKIKEAQIANVELLLFPELAITGAHLCDILLLPHFFDHCHQALEEIMRYVQGPMAVVVGSIDEKKENPGVFYNSAFVLREGHIIACHHKTVLSDYDVWREKRYLTAGKRSTFFEHLGHRFGLVIGDELWQGLNHVFNPLEEFSLHGITHILALEASPFHQGKVHEKIQLLERIHQEFQTTLWLVNAVGAQDELIFDGGSFVSYPSGQRLRAPFFQEELFITSMESILPNEDQKEIIPDHLELVKDAIVTGIREYCLQNSFSDVHLGLSGGIDSALVAILAVEALGAQHVKAFLLPSPYSSAHSISDARALAQNIGIKNYTLPITESFEALLKTLDPVFSAQGLSKENLQARIRGILLMAYSNQSESLLLTTGNKSEVAVGYATLYGDMCGGLNPIGDLFKTEVYALCKYLNSTPSALKEVPPGERIPTAILYKEPSAELRPHQRDSDTLPPYSVLDDILQQLLVQKKAPKLVTGHSSSLVHSVALRIAQSEYKRSQASPLLRLSLHSFGSGRCFPLSRVFFELENPES